jgi:hypothetical protein
MSDSYEFLKAQADRIVAEQTAKARSVALDRILADQSLELARFRLSLHELHSIIRHCLPDDIDGKPRT